MVLHSGIASWYGLQECVPDVALACFSRPLANSVQLWSTGGPAETDFVHQIRSTDAHISLDAIYRNPCSYGGEVCVLRPFHLPSGYECTVDPH
jgi:hypothetical protein